MTQTPRNSAYAASLIDAFVQSGIRHAVVCPGSRSSPLAIAIAAHAGLRLWTHIDERSAGFFALGLARESRSAVIMLCSSGTAAANFLPAMVEATLARIPLIALTADRPAELRGVGAPQTIDQVGIFGSFAKQCTDLPLPEPTAAARQFARLTAARAYEAACTAPAGPVHVNVPFREPLLDEQPDGARDDGPAPRAIAGERFLGRDALDALAASLARAERPCIVCGPHDEPDFAAAVARLAAALDAPIFADALSQVRSGPHDRSRVIDSYDVFLRIPSVRDAFAPDCVIRFGALPTSKALWQRLEALTTAEYVLIDGGGGWRDPLARATQVVHADARATCEALATQLMTTKPRATEWLDHLRSLDARTRTACTAATAREAPMFEGRVLAEIAAALPEGTTLMAGNSMPVRDLDAFVRGSAQTLRFAANRGANGIDGVISSALGAAAAGSRVVLAVGDLSFFHDAGGLVAARMNGIAATIVVINNDGGGIFSFLPQAAVVEHERFERVFGTPTHLDPCALAAVYGARTIHAETYAALRSAIRQSFDEAALTVIEVRTERDANVHAHRAVWDAVAAELESPTNVALA